MVQSVFFNLKLTKLSGSVFQGGEWKTVPNRWAAPVQGPWCQSVLPLGREIVQRWTAVPRAGHIGSEITHSIYGSLRVLRLTDLAILLQTGRQLAAQSFSQGQPPSIIVSGLQHELARKALFCWTELHIWKNKRKREEVTLRIEPGMLQQRGLHWSEWSLYSNFSFKCSSKCFK